jgi:SAM-dependent methyltransferase
MFNDVTDPRFWRDRLSTCGGDLQRAMFTGSSDEFAAAHADQMRQLHRAGIRPHDSVLDVGCGYGRLLTLMPADWAGDYVGIDVSPDLIAVARILYPEQTRAGSRHRAFRVERADAMPAAWSQTFDVAIAVWLHTMLTDNGKLDVWQQIELEMRRVARRVVVVW